ncbi:serine/threonine-protein phosphatase 6 regulatory ankyrin repeat subunit B-like isoform X2 [Pomacea canaliculata]|uniref:serine/threonine-protein phosphatase 6 regulatory ankyrin repeat subunit B-like isoform X2 n=1 Tax=Pomacea canaliculata TaxID=400727 RepID=UPI000D73D258|nr:serine/threonine-protein phosphatase 6 regulatory ankyrin repeat subunit B-like isoform X2 [Pomacea canaliculata]
MEELEHDAEDLNQQLLRIQEALYNAIDENNLVCLRQLLEQGANVDQFYEDDQNISSKSILHIACGKGRTECVKILLEAGAMADIRDKWGQTPLMYCICVQFLDTAGILLDHLGASATEIVNNQDRFGKSALHSAAETNNVEAVELLLHHGADVNIQNFDGVTPLMVAAENCGCCRSLKAMEALIRAGALVNCVDYRSKRSALQRASLSKNVAAVELLLASGADVDSLDATGRSGLTNLMWDHVRNRKGLCHIDPDVMTIIVLLTQSTSNLDLSVCEYSNPLVTATFLQATVLVRFFLEQGAQPNVSFVSGVTPLLIATSKKDLETVKILLSFNCHMSIKGRVFRRRHDTEFTFDPCEMAVDDESYHIVQLFLQAGYNAQQIKKQLRLKLNADSKDCPSNVDPQLRQWLLDRASQPPSLKEIIVFKIRKILDQDLHKAVTQLPLPSRGNPGHRS